MQVYQLLATALPALQAPGALLDPTSAAPTPTTWSPLVSGASGPGSMSLPMTRNAVRGDAQGRYAGGIDAVWTGLDLAADVWPNVHVTVGQAGIDGPSTVPAQWNSTIVNGTNYLWLSQAGVLTIVAGSTAAPAGGRWLYLGAWISSGGIVTSIDYSGRMTLGQGSTAIRRTGDVGPPGDTPPASLRFLAQTVDGLYLWNGAAYLRMQSGPLSITRDLIPAGDAEQIPAGYTSIVSELTIDGDLIVDGSLRLL